MDEYLNSLKKKESIIEVEKVLTETTEPEVVVKSDLEIQVEEENKEKEIKEEPTKETVAEEVIEDEIEHQSKLDPSIAPDVDSQPKRDYDIGEEIDVTGIKVFRTPDIHQVAWNISGRVIFLGRIDGFAIINFMRHGFGLVKGYTLNI